MTDWNGLATFPGRAGGEESWARGMDKPVVTDEMVSAALTEWYPGEWPDDDVFDKTDINGLTFRELSMCGMRKAIEAALLCLETKKCPNEKP